MKRHSPSRTRSTPDRQRIAVITVILATLSLNNAAGAQTRSVRDTSTAYGARLNAKGEPANLNPNRINNRINSRLDTRLSLRVERYRPDSTNDPAAAFVTRPMDNARVGTDTTLSPLSVTPETSSAASQAYQTSSQTTSSERTDNSAPRR